MQQVRLSLNIGVQRMFEREDFCFLAIVLPIIELNIDCATGLQHDGNMTTVHHTYFDMLSKVGSQ